MSAARSLVLSSRVSLRHTSRTSVSRSLSSSASSSKSSSPSPSSDPQPARPELTYKRPIPPGRIPAYDYALEVIEAEKRAKLDYLAKEGSKVDPLEREKIEAHAEQHDPEIRWRAKAGLADLSKPVYRKIKEVDFRTSGRAAILMQRLSQMGVLPDVLREFHPQSELQIVADGQAIEPGSFSLPDHTFAPPALHPNLYHGEERLYTMMLVDPDVPNTETESYSTSLLWLAIDIPLSATSSPIIPSAGADATSMGTTILPYLPPHPASGTPPHRFTFILLAQPSTKPSLNANDRSHAQREHFDVMSYAETHALVPFGCTFTRQQWSPIVSTIYADMMKVTEPRYGSPPRISAYRLERALAARAETADLDEDYDGYEVSEEEAGEFISSGDAEQDAIVMEGEERLKDKLAPSALFMHNLRLRRRTNIKEGEVRRIGRTVSKRRQEGLLDDRKSTLLRDPGTLAGDARLSEVA